MTDNYDVTEITPGIVRTYAYGSLQYRVTVTGELNGPIQGQVMPGDSASMRMSVGQEIVTSYGQAQELAEMVAVCWDILEALLNATEEDA